MRVPAAVTANAAAARQRLLPLSASTRRPNVAPPRNWGLAHTSASVMGCSKSSTGAPMHWMRVNPRLARHMSIDKYSLFGGNEAGEQRTSVDSYNKHGFMVNGVLVQGAVILLPETTLLWNVSTMEDITSESLVVLRLLLTKPELCIFGTGRRLQRTPQSIDLDMKAMGIPYDTMDTVNALATFNVLNQEGRNVAGVFLPLDPVDVQQTYTAEAKPQGPFETKPRGSPTFRSTEKS